MRVILIKRKRLFILLGSLLLTCIVCYGCFFMDSDYESGDFGSRARVYNVKLYPEKKYSIRYLRFECVKSPLSGCGGLADRLKGILSAYAWSLLTDRKFVIKVTDPCPLESALLPNQVDWLLDLDSTPIDTREDIYMYYDQNYMKELETINILNYTNAQLLNIRSGLMFMDYFSKNPNLQSKIISLGYSPANFTVISQFRSLYNRLFRLTVQLEERYQEFLKKIGKSTLICAQVRLGHIEDRYFTPESDIPKFWEFINSSLIQPGLVGTDWKIYVTSDHEYPRDLASQVFGSDRVLFYRNSSVHIEMVYRKHKFKDDDVAKYQNLVLDFHTMQNCEYAVLSHSGYGILGVVNRDQPDKNVWVYTDPESIRTNYWKRENYRFIKVEPGFSNIYFL